MKRQSRLLVLVLLVFATSCMPASTSTPIALSTSTTPMASPAAAATRTEPATVVPTPTDTPTMTSTLTRSPPIIIASNYSDHTDGLGLLYIAGELTNNTDQYLNQVEVKADLYDAGGNLVGVARTFTGLSTVPPGLTTCFRLIASPPAGWKTYQFEPPTFSTHGHPLPSLTPLNVSGAYHDRGPHSEVPYYELLGQIRNDSGKRVNNVYPVVTFYDGQGKVMNCDGTLVNSTDLLAGQTGSFTLVLNELTNYYAGVTSYKVQVDGSSQ